MALKATLEQWDQATQAYDQQDYNTALDLFEIKSYISALYLDQYFAIAYFQKGVSNAKLGDWEAAFDDFNDSLLYLRGNLFIDYKQLGLDYKLYSCEVLFNRGVCYMQLNEDELGRKDFETARREKQLPDHARVDLAISRGWETQPIFKLPRGKLFRPDESKLKNSKKVDYLGKAKLIASHNAQDTDTGFSGTSERKAMSEKTTAPIPRSNALQSSLDDPSVDGRNRPAGHNLSRNHTHIGNLSLRSTASNDLLRSNSINDMHRRPSVGGQNGRLRAPPGPINTANQRPVSPLGATKNGLVSPLPRRNTDGVAPPRIDTTLLQAKKSYEGFIQRSPDGLSPGGHSPSGAFATTNLSTGSAAKLTRTDSRTQALALARQNSMDRRSPGLTPRTLETNGRRSPNPTQNGVGGGAMRRQPSARELGASASAKSPTPPTSTRISIGQWNTAALAASIPEGKIKLKCHYKEDTRYLMVDSKIALSELRMRVTDKFSCRRLLQLKYRDEDNELVQIPRKV
ncbi:hypothetical protein BDF22DRAFT_653603 [Syncephalis plumigaleata]|nr:hypothetical protein BDF22DRAFT_653603 [Syncephalis plumigaleata]